MSTNKLSTKKKYILQFDDGLWNVLTVEGQIISRHATYHDAQEKLLSIAAKQWATNNVVDFMEYKRRRTSNGNS